MDYVRYEKLIVETFGAVLVGWPFLGHIRNPGTLNVNELIVLRDALINRECHWKILEPHELEARWDNNQQRAANGEEVYGPVRKQRARKKGPIDTA
jgi:hypothetical protein